ncbi:MAG: hypothetical protein L0Y72_27320, partial [Gemmataceae bacterium]|nr:hypothetical protein [Gemmataceae bacterium]MCI0742762.1 hypothetical protein [Gemmataceae bacterium]
AQVIDPKVINPKVLQVVDPKIINPKFAQVIDPKVINPKVLQVVDPKIINPKFAQVIDPKIINPKVLQVVDPKIVNPKIIDPKVGFVLPPHHMHHHHHTHHHHHHVGWWPGFWGYLPPWFGWGGDTVIGGGTTIIEGGTTIVEGTTVVEQPPAMTYFYEKNLKVKNDTKEKVQFLVLYHTMATGKWTWLPDMPDSFQKVFSFELEPGAEFTLNDGMNLLSANRMRLVARSATRSWTGYAENDLWTVDADASGERRYLAPAMETFTFYLPE